MTRKPNPSDTCRICGNHVSRPYRVYDVAGKVVQGCVDSDHDGHLAPLSESMRWHNRPEAKRVRWAINNFSPIPR